MRFDVTEIEFDFDDWYALNWDIPITPDEAKAITESALGICDALDEDDLIEIITDGTGWCIKSIDYEIINDSSTLNNINGATL